MANERRKRRSALGLALCVSSTIASAASAQRVEEGFVVTPDGVRLFYQKVGTAPLTLLLPGRLFAFDELRALADEATIVAYDMRNRGRSELVADDAAISFEHDVADLEAVRRHFRLERVALAGYSYLGRIVVLYALEHPERVERIVQLGPIPPDFTTVYRPEFEAHDDPVDPEALAALRKRRSEESFHVTHPRQYCEEEWRVVHRPRLAGDPAKVDRIAIDVCPLPNEWPLLQVRHLRLHFQESGAMQKTPLDRVRALTTPVLTVHGTRDRNAPYGAGREWSYLLPNGRLLTVEGAGHHAFGEAREAVLPALREFLRGGWPAAAQKVTEDPRK